MKTIAKIATVTGAKWLQKKQSEAQVEHLLLDSRQITAPAVSLFFALPGKRNDGHDYLSELYRSGVRQFIVSQPVALENLPEANVLLVENSLAALQGLAAAHRREFSIPVIGITGSNGKTIVKEWLFQLLRPDFEIVRSPKSYNSQVGVPLSVWQLQKQHTLAIFEAGISQPGEMQNLQKIIRPDIGVFTNIGPAHREGFESKSLKISEKMRLFDAAKVLVFCSDDEKIAAAAERWLAEVPGREIFAWSRRVGEATSRPETMQLIEIQQDKKQQTKLTAIFKGEKQSITIPFTDEASIENACHCWTVLLLFGIENSRIAARMRRLEPVEMRLELKAGVNRCTIINDAYNLDFNSLEIAMNFAASQGRGGRLTLMLSDILQSGQPLEKLYGKVAAAILEKNFSRLIAIGEDVLTLKKLLPGNFRMEFFETTDDFLRQIQNADFADELVLLKGARPFEFEKIARRLEQKAHKTVLEVNLSAMVHNLNVYSKLLSPGVKMLAMVKAAGYGSGAAEVAKLLEYHKVNYLGVAYADEGIELRQAGVKLPILVLNPEAASFDALFRFRLEPEIYSLPVLYDLLHFAGRDKKLSIHLKLDTGMHRLGFESKDLPELLEILKKHPNLEVKSIFSHLAASDSAAHDDFTKRQGELFGQMSEQISGALNYQPLRHIVNTGGIARFPEFHFDMVRLGIGLYGIDSSGLQGQLRVVNALKATISQIKEIPAGETVGYNRAGAVEKLTRIATISIGYADGFLRLASNGKFSVLIHGKPAPTVGRVCMDMTMVDVTEIEEAREGDEVVVFGEGWPVQRLAECLQTIPYEVFTNISERVKRVYFQE